MECLREMVIKKNLTKFNVFEFTRKFFNMRWEENLYFKAFCERMVHGGEQGTTRLKAYPKKNVLFTSPIVYDGRKKYICLH